MATDLMTNRNPMDTVLKRLTDLERTTTQKADAGLRAAGLILERAMKEELSHPGTGHVYGGAASRKTGKKRHTHQASAPGQPPAPDTGTLRASIGSGVVDGNLRVGTGLAYGRMLNNGTLGDHGYIAPRPWAKPALENARPQMGSVFVGALQGGTP